MGSDARKIPFLKDRMKLAMKEKKVKQKDIARLLDRNLDTVKGMFRDQKMLPEHLVMIARALDVDVLYLTDENVPNINSFTDETMKRFFALSSRLDANGYEKGSFEEYRQRMESETALKYFTEFMHHVKRFADRFIMEDGTVYTVSQYIKDWCRDENISENDVMEELMQNTIFQLHDDMKLYYKNMKK